MTGTREVGGLRRSLGDPDDPVTESADEDEDEDEDCSPPTTPGGGAWRVEPNPILPSFPPRLPFGPFAEKWALPESFWHGWLGMTITQTAEAGSYQPSTSETEEAAVELPLIAARRREASTPRALPPAARFTSQPHRARTVRDAERARAIVLFVPCTERGRLGAAIDADMEAVLASRGAMPPSVSEGATIRAVVRDQVNRAAALPVRGICVCLPKLTPLTTEGVLDDGDATALSAWIDAARAEKRLRLVVLFDEEDRGISMRVPTPLETILGAPPAPAKEISDRIGVTPAPSAVVEVPDLAVGAEEAAACAAEPVGVAPIADTLRPPAPTGDMPSFEADLVLEIRESPVVVEEDRAGVLDAIDMAWKAVASQERAENERRAAELAAAERAETERAAAERAEAEARAKRAEQERRDAERREAERLEAEQRAAERAEAERAARLVHAAQWRQFAMDLDAARGPKPASMIEKLYAQRYVPLLGAISRGETDAAVEGVVHEWRTSFAESYDASFGSVRVTAKRPSMVMDAPEIALKVSRLASARSVKLILVDSMSFDLAERVGARIAHALDKRAVLVEKSVLWAALPSTTPVQMHLLARGAEGFRDIPGPVSEPEVARGRTVGTMRRERIGNREILKLDLVESRLRASGGSYDERLDGIADEVADILVRTFEQLPARTLAYVFGDHGFALKGGANGWETGPSSQGGASPEEVLVAGHGWLVDAVQ